MTVPGGTEHRQLRELLGAYALDGLPAELHTMVEAHLDGCPACQAELAELAPLAADLRTVDPDRLSIEPTPPAELGQRISATIAAERELRDARAGRAARSRQVQRTTRRTAAAAAAVVVVAASLGSGALVGRATAPAPAVAKAVPVERVAVTAAGGVQVVGDGAGVVAHTWGVEAKVVATGFEAGRTYRAWFRSDDGELLPAGEFLGTGDKALTCNLQAALLREDTVAFQVTDDAGQTVLQAEL